MKSPGYEQRPMNGASRIDPAQLIARTLHVRAHWAYSSDCARHTLEGRTPSLEEAELVVGIASVVATFLAKKVGSESLE